MTANESWQIVLFNSGNNTEIILGMLSDEITTRYLLMSLTQHNLHKDYTYYARHIQIHKIS
jgi:hypothetical protein